MDNLRTLLFRWTPPFILTAFGLIAINLIWLVPTVQNIRASASVLALEVADRIRSESTFYLNGAIDQLNFAAEDIVTDPKTTPDELTRVLRENPGFRRLALLDKSGTETVRVARDADGQRSPWAEHSKESYFYLALEGSANLGQTYLLQSDNSPYTTVAVPVMKDDAVTAVLVGELKLEPLVAILGDLKTERGIAYIVDQNGRRILHADPKELSRQPDFSGRAIVQKVVSDGQVADGLATDDSYTNEKGERVFAVGVPITIGHMGLIIEEPRSVALNGEEEAIIISLATVILGLLVLIFIVRSNIRLSQLNVRLRELLGETDRVGKMLVRRDLELTQANTRLEDLDAVKSEFVSVAAHQLRTPMTGIKWSLASMLEDEAGLKAEQKQTAREAFNAVNHLTELINDLLDVARLEEGRMGVTLMRGNFSQLVRRIFEQFKRIADAKGVDFFLEMQPEIPPLDFDEEKITMVLDNLIDNAIKYTSPGGKVYLTLSSDGKVATIAVRDSGIGIPKSQQDRVFSKFFRSDNAQLYQTSGTGLGLYVSQNIVQQHKGRIWFDSIEEGGSTFFFSLPIPQGDPSLRAATAPIKNQ